MVAVVTLLSYGCPVQAIVAAFELDERTVARWQKESGTQCKRVHEHLVEAGRVALLQVQADEIRVKAVGKVYWLAQAMEVKSRLWLGGVISRHRDKALIRALKALIRALMVRVRACGAVEKILLVTDGLASYKSQALTNYLRTLRVGYHASVIFVDQEGHRCPKTRPNRSRFLPSGEYQTSCGRRSNRS